MAFNLLITFGSYFIIMTAIGLAAYTVTKSLSDYVLGGRQLSATVAGASAGASDMSGWLFLGLPGAVYASGLNQIWIAIGLTIGAWLNWQFVARRLRVYTEVASNAITLPDYFEKRFHDGTHLLRLISAIVILLFFTFYVSAGLTGAARLFHNSFRIDYSVALWIAGVFVIAYTLFGGFLAACWTHFLQATLMIVALVLVPSVAIYQFGGWGAMTDAVAAIDPARLDVLNGMTSIGIISLLAWGLGYFGQPHILMRFMAIRSSDDLPRALATCMTWMIVVLAGAVITGLAGSAYFAKAPLASSESVYETLAQFLFSPWIAGILLTAILAAIVSTIDSQLLVSSSALAEDLYRAILRRGGSHAEYIWVGRLTVAIVMLVAVLLAYNQQETVLSLVAYAWAGFGAAFGPVVILSLAWRRMTRSAALAGMIVGAVTVVAWKNLPGGGIFDLYEIVPGFVLSAAVIVIVSLLSPAPNPEILDEFDTTQTSGPVDADALNDIPG